MRPRAAGGSLLLRDIMTPKPMRREWPAEARWRYHGLPEKLILDPGTAKALDSGLSSIAPVLPNAVLVDRASAYRSAAFEDACARYDITSTTPARAVAATSPTSSGCGTRLVATSRSTSPGTPAGRPARRGLNVEADAVLLKHDVEDLPEGKSTHWGGPPSSCAGPGIDVGCRVLPGRCCAFDSGRGARRARHRAVLRAGDGERVSVARKGRREASAAVDGVVRALKQALHALWEDNGSLP